MLTLGTIVRLLYASTISTLLDGVERKSWIGAALRIVGLPPLSIHELRFGDVRIDLARVL
jgi:hypothetical protein